MGGLQMKKRSCDKTPDVLAAANSGRLESLLRRHVDGCGICRDELLLEGYIRLSADRGAEALPDRGIIPDVETIWEGARNIRAWKKDLERKALRPLLIPRILTYTLGAGGAIFLLGSQWTVIKKYLGEYSDSLALLNSFTGSVAKLFGSSPLLAAVTGLATLFMAIFVVYSLVRPGEV
jgi:hypothetical protein